MIRTIFKRGHTVLHIIKMILHNLQYLMSYYSCVPSLRIVPEKEFVLLMLKVEMCEKGWDLGCLKMLEIRTGVSCQVLKRSIYYLVSVILLNHCILITFFE